VFYEDTLIVHCKLSFLDCSFGQKDSAVFFFNNFGDVFFFFANAVCLPVLSTINKLLFVKSQLSALFSHLQMVLLQKRKTKTKGRNPPKKGEK